jgi:hypothetical protein
MDPVQNAQRESLYREVNERVVELSRKMSVPHLEVLCECGRGCLERIHLPLEAYDRIRRDRTLFALVAGHDDPDVESVVETTDAYEIVQKTGVAADIARMNFHGISAA